VPGAQQLCRARERGVLVGVGGQEGNVLRVQPPLVITQQELGRALDVMDEALAAVAPRVPVP
jgi:4-aminobutyrate aminotransferase-like enzyme